MERNMKINANLVRELREARGWSQDHLATVAGVSLRTIQRVEADGAAGAETRMALAAALDVPATSLSPNENGGPPISKGHKWGLILGMGGAGLGTLLGWLGIAAGGMTGQDAGVAAAIVGIIGGLSMGAIGIVSNHYRSTQRTSPNIRSGFVK